MFNFFRVYKKRIVYSALVLYWLILLLLTSLPSESLPSVKVWDKLEHFLAYLGLGFLLNATLIVQDKYPLLKKHPVLFTLVFGSFYGIMDELHQLFIPGRSCDILDWTADTIGIILGIITINLILLLFTRLNHSNN